jgi:hypothetical protein
MPSLLDKKKRADLIFFAVYPLVAAAISIYFKVDLLTCGILFFGIPSIYLSFKVKHKIPTALGFSSIIGIFLAVIIDYLGYLDKSWRVIPSLFSFRIFDVIPLEDPIWIFLVAYELILLYEYFFNPKPKYFPKSKSKLSLMLFISMFIFGVFMFLKIQSPNILHIPYFYFVWSTLTIVLPCIIFLFVHPKLIGRFIAITSYTFYVGLLSELVSLHLNYWEFPGSHFIGWVTILGLTFPIEEFIFFLMFIPPAFLVYYEFFADDEK